MKIGVMSQWNVPSAMAMHAEPIVRSWLERGHEVKVFANREWDELPPLIPDEPYVVRCYRLNQCPRDKQGWFFNPEPFLEDKLDVFVVENLERMPLTELLGIWPKIKKRSKTVLIIHEPFPPPYPEFYEFNWDAIVCFDQRYKDRFLKNFYPEKLIHIIPYPCYILQHGDKKKAREELNLPQDEVIVFTYGLGVQRKLHLLPALEHLSKRYPLTFCVLTDMPQGYKPFEAAKERYPFIELRKERVPIKLLATYLYAADAFFVHRENEPQAVRLSSMIYTVLGAGCPTLAYNTNFVEDVGDVIIRYSSLDDFQAKLEDIFEGKEYVREILEKADKFAEEHSGEKLGIKYLELFRSLLLSEVKLHARSV